MTQENRYLTIRVNGQLLKEMQLRFWLLSYEKLKESEVNVDYLQVFGFNRDDQQKNFK
ncbi:DUF960 family protein [Enterococcus sp. DIV0187]|uniref:DUF960 family protein n=1 Tax=Enterococcus sp. DIV0187 TaxID=2774644 RepID=UPI003F1F8D3D